jgi:hypothetical protein
MASVKLTISVPEDVAAYLATCPNTSREVVAALRPRLPEHRRARQRAAAESYAAYLRTRTPEQIEDDNFWMETSNDIALAGAEW